MNDRNATEPTQDSETANVSGSGESFSGVVAGALRQVRRNLARLERRLERSSRSADARSSAEAEPGDTGLDRAGQMTVGRVLDTSIATIRKFPTSCTILAGVLGFLIGRRLGR